MKYSDYPTLYQASDTASLRQQKHHIRAVIFESSFVILAAVSSGFFLISKTENQLCSLMTAIFLGGALVARLLMKFKNWERDWFGTRAIAESIKTITWRYVMGVSPYQNSLPVNALTQKLTSEIDIVFKTLPDIAAAVSPECVGQPIHAVSARMTEIRSLPTQERKSIYITTRVSDQRDWYARKTAENKGKADFWICIILLSEFAGMGIAIYLISNQTQHFNPLGLVTTLTAALCAWAQTKRYQELAQAYGLATTELGRSEALAHGIQTDAELAKYVEETEDAISREHTMWTAKRK